MSLPLVCVTLTGCTVDEMLKDAEELLLNEGLVRKGQKFIFTAGVPVGISGSTNLLKVHQVEGVA